MNYRKKAGFFFVSDPTSTGGGCIDVVGSFSCSTAVDGSATNTKRNENRLSTDYQRVT